MYKLLACDLDETLLGTDHHVPQRNKEAIKKAIEQGTYIVPASGRSFNIMQDVLKELGIYQKKDTYSISFNGACITENYQNRICDLQPALSWDLCNHIWKWGCDLGDVDVHIYTLNTIWTTPLCPADREVFEAINIPAVETTQTSIEFLKGTHIVKILYMNLDIEYLHKIAQEIPDIPKEIEVTYSSDRYLEFNAHNTNKGEGLKRLAAKLGIDMSETIAIGDSDNDKEMIAAAGLGVAMANADVRYQKMADYVTHFNNDEGGVAEVIEKFIL